VAAICGSSASFVSAVEAPIEKGANTASALAITAR
jgi:hypothetical protein